MASTATGLAKVTPQRGARTQVTVPSASTRSTRTTTVAPSRGSSANCKRQPLREMFSRRQVADRSGNTNVAVRPVASLAIARLPSLPKGFRITISSDLHKTGEQLVRTTPDFALRLPARRLAINRSAPDTINGRWYCYQRPLRLIFGSPLPEGNSFRFRASGSATIPKECRFTKLLLVCHPALISAVRL
jgi:hypothetical protein